MKKYIIITCCVITLIGGCSSSKDLQLNEPTETKTPVETDVSAETDILADDGEAIVDNNSADNKEPTSTNLPIATKSQTDNDTSEKQKYKDNVVYDDFYLANITDDGKVNISFNDGENREVKEIKDAVQLERSENEIIALGKDGRLTFYSVEEDKIIDDFPSASEIGASSSEVVGAGVGAYADWKKSLMKCTNIEKLLFDDNLQYYIAFKKDKSAVGSSMQDVNFQKKVDECATWTNITKYVCNGYDILGLKKDGTVICTNKEISNELAEEWTDIIDIEAGGSFLGLKADGTVLSLVGELEYKTLGWSDIKQISVSLFCAAGLKADGTVVVAGRDFGHSEAKKWNDIVYVQVTDTYVMGIKENGEVVTTTVME